MTFRPDSSYSLTEVPEANWEYSKTIIPQRARALQPFASETQETIITLEPPEFEEDYELHESQRGFFEEDYKLSGPVRPFIPPTITKTLEKWWKRPLTDKEATKVMKNIAEIAIDFYNIQKGKYIAVGFDGRIVESADSSFDLLMKIQGRELPIRTFVWHVGSDAFAGWGI